MFKGVRLAGHPDTESCRRSATPTASTPESRLRPLLPRRHQERPLAAPLGRARANCRRISQASFTVPSIESRRLLNVLELLRKDGPSTPGGFWTWFHQAPQPAWRSLDHKTASSLSFFNMLPRTLCVVGRWRLPVGFRGQTCWNFEELNRGEDTPFRGRFSNGVTAGQVPGEWPIY